MSEVISWMWDVGCYPIDESTTKQLRRRTGYGSSRWEVGSTRYKVGNGKLKSSLRAQRGNPMN